MEREDSNEGEGLGEWLGWFCVMVLVVLPSCLMAWRTPKAPAK